MTEFIPSIYVIISLFLVGLLFSNCLIKAIAFTIFWISLNVVVHVSAESYFKYSFSKGAISALESLDSTIRGSKVVDSLTPGRYIELLPELTDNAGYVCSNKITSDLESNLMSLNETSRSVVVMGIDPITDELTCCNNASLNGVQYRDTEGGLQLRCGTWPLTRIVTVADMSKSALTVNHNL